MTVNQNFGDWEVITDEPGDDIIWEHKETGNRVRMDRDGGVHSKALDTERLSSIRFADSFSGTNGQSKIQAAVGDLE